MDCSSIIYENDTEENFSDIKESFNTEENADIKENYNAKENADIEENYNAKENANIEENYKAIKEGNSNWREEPNAKESKSEETIYAECENYLKKWGYPCWCQ